MVEQDWTLSKVTQDHLQGLESQGFMTAVELMTCHVPENPISLVSVEGYMVSFVAFYKQGFSVPPVGTHKTPISYANMSSKCME
jgi:hypothetical protein